MNMSNNLPADPIEEPELDEGEESDEYEFEVRLDPFSGGRIAHIRMTQEEGESGAVEEEEEEEAEEGAGVGHIHAPGCPGCTTHTHLIQRARGAELD